MVNRAVWETLHKELAAAGATLVAVSKTKPASDIKELYDLGQRHFGENYVQELVSKQAELPADIQWHYIGHLQSNKVKYIAPFVHLVHAVDSFGLLKEINKQAAKNSRVIDVLLQMHIADEETKFGMDEADIFELMEYYTAQKEDMQNVRICGLMGMASNTDDEQKIRSEFARLNNFFIHLAETSFLGKPYFAIRSIGMSSDYHIALAEGGNMVRIGSMLFGNR
ncbi:YggS family pyridoxal phosphate-dependent enzyme [Nemorincola caseinilytica]|uniref:Pyridoxal phosphate homeostasis protein n=1 Tax=Nemorincola caseinilytica TaxID=2054315 RepID=A0ABP8NGR8_9BACT